MRASFRNWAREQQHGSNLAAESALGFTLSENLDPVPTGFAPLEDRRRLLQNWAAFLKTGESPRGEARQMPGLLYVRGAPTFGTLGAISHR